MQKTEADEPLAQAIQYLGAVEVAPGKYAWKLEQEEHEAPEWYVSSSASLKWFGRDTELAPLPPVINMPSWWSPEQRFAVRNGHGQSDDGISATDSSREQCRAHIRVYGKRGDRIITADLATGEEVPA